MKPEMSLSDDTLRHVAEQRQDVRPLSGEQGTVDDYDVDADLRMHKEDRLRLRAENLRLERERDEAFQRGAEAMRDLAAASMMSRFGSGWISQADAARVIRTLPIPEDR